MIPAAAIPCLRLQVVLAVGGRTLVYLELSGEGQIVEKGRLQLDSDIACLDITPVGKQRCRELPVATNLARPHQARWRVP
jgi:hypothetical protein